METINSWLEHYFKLFATERYKLDYSSLIKPVNLLIMHVARFKRWPLPRGRFEYIHSIYRSKIVDAATDLRLYLMGWALESGH